MSFRALKRCLSSSAIAITVTASLVLAGTPVLAAQDVPGPQPPDVNATEAETGGAVAGAPASPGAAPENPAAGRPDGAGHAARPGEEITQARTRTSRTFAETGGVQRTAFSKEAQNYLDGEGRWQPIDNTLVASDAPGYARRNAANSYRVDLPADLSDAPVRMTTGAAWVAFALRGAAGPAAFGGAVATYAGVLQDVDVSYQAEPDGIKELLTLHSAQAQNSFQFDLTTAPGLKIVAQDSGELTVTEADGTVVMTVPAPFMTDATGTTSYQVQYALQRARTGWLLTVTADRAWLEAPDRAWPVVVDPAIYTSSGGGAPTCTIASATPTDSGGCTEMRAGKTSTGAEQRGLLNFDVARFYPKAAVILDAELQLGLLSATTGNAASVNVAGLTKPHSAQATWNTTNGTTAWTSPGGDSIPAGTTAVSTTGTPGALRWYPTELVQKWVEGTTAEHGFLLQSTGTNVLTFGGSGASYPNYPVLTVRYDPSSGDRPSYSMDRHTLTDRTTLAVNRASGNAFVSVNHLQLDGPGLDLQLGHVYNAGVWELSPARLLRRPSGSIDFTAPDGSIVPFLPNGAGKWKTPPGINADLAAAGPDAYTLTFRQSGEVWNFAKKQTFGSNQDLAFHRTKVADKNGNAITYVYVDLPDGPMLSSVTDTAGRVTTFSSSRVNYRDRYDSITDPMQRVTTFAYNSCTGCLSSVTNADNKTTSFGYDADSQLVKITDPLGNQTNITYDNLIFFDRVSAVTRVTDTTAQTGPTTSYHYPANRLTENQASLETSTTGWSARNGTVARSTAQAREGAASLAATSNGSLWVTTAAGTAAVPAEPDRTYTGRFSVRAGTNGANVYAGLTFYDTNGATLPNIWGEPLLDSSAAWNDRVWVRGKAPAGTKYVSLEAYFTSTASGTVHYLDRASVTVDRAYLRSSDPVTWNPGLPYALPAGCAGQDATRQVSPNGGSTTYCFDSTGKATTVTNPLGHNRATTYSPNDDIATAADAMGVGNAAGNTTNYSYDSDFRPTGSSTPTNALSTLSYAEPTGTVTNRAAHYQPSGSTDSDGSTSSYGYDGPGNLTTSSTTTPTGAVTSTFTYNSPVGTAAACGGKPGQRCTATDGRGKVTSYSYNTLGELTGVNNPAPLGDESRTYDGAGRLATRTDGKGQVSRYSYDHLDRTTQVLLAGATSCTSTVRSAGNCLSYTYDANGNQLTQIDQTGTITYGYDKLGRETSRSLPSTGTTALTYDANGNTLTATDGSGAVTYRYDAANQLTSLAEPGTSCPATGTATGCTRFGYNANGLRTTTTYPTSTATVMTVTPDNSGRVKQIKAVTGTAVHSDFAYTYSRTVSGVATDGALVRTRTESPGTTAALTTTNGYDTLSRLTSAVETNTGGTTTASWGYGYDPAGNRTLASLSGTPGAAQTTFGYNDANQLNSRNGSTTGFAYDANGNETAGVGAKTRTAGAWNAKEQLTSITAGGTAVPFTYTGNGNETRLSAADTTYRNTALGVTAHTASGATTSFVRDPSGTLIALRVGTASYYYLYDALGSVTGLVNASGTKVNTYRYDPYGISRAKTEAVANPYQYTGGHLDAATGLYKLGIRYYDPTLGRFTQPDPTGQDPHYTYARNNPVNFVDPTGALSCIIYRTLCSLGTAVQNGVIVTAGAILDRACRVAVLCSLGPGLVFGPADPAY